MDLEAVNRKLAAIAEGRGMPRLDEFGNLAVSQVLPKYAAMAAAGLLFVADMSGGTGKIPVTAAPTTSPEWALYNYGVSNVIVPLCVAYASISGTLGLGHALMVATALGPQTAVSANYASSIVTCTDGTSKKPDCYFTNNPTLIGGTPAWMYYQAVPSSIATIAVGEGGVVWLNGAHVARPGGYEVAFEIVAPTGTSATYDLTILFAQLPLKLR